MPEGFCCDLIRDTTSLLAFAPDWSRLWQQDSSATPFQSPEWLLPWWRQFGQPDLRAAVITQAGRPIAFLPFYVYRKQETGERQLLLIGAGTSDYLDGVFDSACTPQHLAAALELLAEHGGWDSLYASQLLPGSRLYQALASMGSAGCRRFPADGCSRMPAVTLPDLPQKIRRNAMYYRNRAMRRGRLEFTIADSSDCAESFEALQRLHTSRWEARGEPGVLADPRVVAWHREAVPLLQRAGLLRLCCLRLDGEIIGALYSFIDSPSRPAPTQYFYLTAYSPDHADLRPGTLLLAYAIEQAAQDGIHTIDMLRGEEAYKQFWHMQKRPTWGFAMARANMMGAPESSAA